MTRGLLPAHRITGGTPRQRTRRSKRATFTYATSTVALAGAGLAAGVAILGSAGSAGAAPSRATTARAARVPAAPAPAPSASAARASIGTFPESGSVVTNPSLGTGAGNGSAVPRSDTGLVGPSGPAGPAGPAAPTTSTVGVSVTGISGKPSQSITIILLLTVLSVAPALLILCTSFTKIIVVLSMTRNALGLQTIPPNQVLAGLALFLSLFVMGPTLSKVNHEGLQPYLHGTKTQQAAWRDGSAPLKTWMLAQTRKDDLTMLTKLAAQSATSQPVSNPTLAAGAASTGTTGSAAASTIADSTDPTGSDTRVTATAEAASKISLTTLVPAFILSELKSAFIIGFVIFLPFLVIDLVVASSLMSLGMAMVPPVLVSLPFKILLFLMVDGWALIIHSLVVSYR